MHLVEIIDSFLTNPKVPCQLSSPTFENARRFAQAIEDSGEGNVTMAIYDTDEKAISFERIDSDLKTFVVNFYDGKIEFMDDRAFDRANDGHCDEIASLEYDDAIKCFLNQGAQ